MEWEQASLRPRNYKELYNLRHSKLCNAIEQIFGTGYGIGGVAAEHRNAQALRDHEEDMDEDEEGELGSTVTAVEQKNALEKRHYCKGDVG
ncbi:hypothetical protein BT96DRAFT_1088478 [Gymnopus androsaceus JB14]|uniref:Uncharacterized protein n=1 Tax=Gymnopus androsaceus JB14 TaxID=1447944 RepID=A0A6A4HY51_9AGAR|nr:hypothetical protein BT96DRAFT_1088478 [Gymnopus androsaceus JB14]